MLDRPLTTLFMLSSVDGRISSGAGDALDPDRDWKLIIGVREGLAQYYQLEKETDAFSLNTGRTFAKIGLNEKTPTDKKVPVTFIVIDNKPHLSQKGIENLLAWGESAIIATSNRDHPAYAIKSSALSIAPLSNPPDFVDLFRKLKADFGAERLTVQSGGEMNATLMRAGVIDRLSIVIAPLAVGGRDTPSLIDGESIHAPNELDRLRPLRLLKCTQLENSYLHLLYEVLPQTAVGA